MAITNFDVGLEAINFGGSYLEIQRSWQFKILVLAVFCEC
jgi:hypothetical protein